MRYSLLFLLAITIIACGGEASQSEATNETATPSSTTAPKVVELTIEGNDQMQYDKKTLEVVEGQTVKLTLSHVGKMNAQAMGHNWVLLKSGMDKAEFATKSIGAVNDGYIAPDYADQVIAHTKMLGGGESETIEFKAPAAGTYDFLCSFPGHYALMNGQFIVKAAQ